MPMTINAQQASDLLAPAIEAGDPVRISEALQASLSEIAERIRGDFEVAQLAGDDAILAQRGYRQLTAPEKRFYEALAAASRQNDAASAQQAFVDIIGDGKDEDLMPSTIIEDVFKDLEQDHELLSYIRFTYTGYSTKWIRNKHTNAKAVWGAITDEIKKEITSDFKTMAVTQNKLTAFLVMPLDIIDMGYTFMDAYARACLKEAVYDGLEYAIISGTGHDEPVGMVRKVADGVSINSTTGYPKKDAIKVTSFGKTEYLGLIAKMSKTEKGRNRKFSEVALVCNMNDYLTKVAPAVTLLTQIGYVNGVFPYATHTVISNEMPDGEAVMFVPGCYTFCVGGSRNGEIVADDSYKFLDDARTYKIIQHGDGIADDDTACLRLDISELEELIPKVETVSAAPAGTGEAASGGTGKGDGGDTPTV